MPAITTEKPKTADLRRIEAAEVAEAKEPKTQKETAKEEIARVSFAQKASINRVQSAPAAQLSDGGRTESKAAESKAAETEARETSDSARTESTRSMVQAADQWRNCRRPHRI